MRFLLSWLQEFVDIPEPPAEFAEAVTRAGFPLEEMEESGGETVFDFEITANRPDVMNHFGLAREAAAIYDRPLRAPRIAVTEGGRSAAEAAAVEIEDPDLCPRYSARVIEGVEVKPSPDWLRKRLELCGVRSVNNIADITNYVLLELGHPTHAFDLDLLAGSKIVVRRARSGEKLLTLDGVERELSPERLVIADAERPVALAGVMGGAETEISEKTRNVLLESAWFDTGTIRRTSRHYNLHTEASHRFARGADIAATLWAADRIATLLAEVSPGVVLRGPIDAYPKPLERSAVPLRKRQIPRHLGIEIPDEETERILKALGFGMQRTEEGWQAGLPSFRLDVEREVDLVEEAARVWGYERLKSTLPAIGRPAERPRFAEEEERLRELARALGYHETISYAFIPAREAERFGAWEPIAIRNPISELHSVMRNTAVPSMVRSLEWNLNRNQSDVRLAEFGRLYRRRDGHFEEPPVLTLGATGAARPPALGDPAKPFSFHDLKADLTALLEPFRIGAQRFDANELPSYYAPGRSARLVSNGGVLAYLGEFEASMMGGVKLRQPVWLAEVFLDRVFERGLRQPRYKPLPRIPAVQRDLSLLVPEGVQFEQIVDAIGPQPHLVSIEPVEIFRGKNVPEGLYSLLLRIAWQREEQSFTDEEVNAYVQEIAATLVKSLGVEQRKEK